AIGDIVTKNTQLLSIPLPQLYYEPHTFEVFWRSDETSFIIGLKVNQIKHYFFSTGYADMLDNASFSRIQNFKDGNDSLLVNTIFGYYNNLIVLTANRINENVDQLFLLDPVNGIAQVLPFQNPLDVAI